MKDAKKAGERAKPGDADGIGVRPSVQPTLEDSG
jgi:hypothetical protein